MVRRGRGERTCGGRRESITHSRILESGSQRKSSLKGTVDEFTKQAGLMKAEMM